MTDVLIGIFVSSGFSGALFGFFFWLFQRSIKRRDNEADENRKKRQAEQDKKEEARAKSEMYIIAGLNATMALGEATARAVQRIPDAKCNGDMTRALAYVDQIKHEQREFMTEQGVHHIYNG